MSSGHFRFGSVLVTIVPNDMPAAVIGRDDELRAVEDFLARAQRGPTALVLSQKKAAREALEQALAIFEELGARLWAERARAELRRIGGRAPRPDELTETERRVAELAAEGRSNNEIAAELFMGVSTVESHLARVYRKLGVRRAGLAARIAIPVDETTQA